MREYFDFKCTFYILPVLLVSRRSKEIYFLIPSSYEILSENLPLEAMLRDRVFDHL